MLPGKTIKIVTFCLIIFGLVACSDNATDTDTPEPPEIPELQQYQPETGYFDSSTQKMSVQAGTGYNAAAQIVQGTVEPMFSTAGVYLPFFSQAQNSEPIYNDGVWEWTYTYNQFGQTAEIRLTAETNESTGSVNWSLYLSTSSSDGMNFDDYQFMTGSTALDGSGGSWNIYPYEPGGADDPVITFDWTRQDEDNYTASYAINTSGTSTTFNITYTEEGPEHTLEVVSADGEHDLVIYWNTDTGTGYIDQAGSDRICWNSNYENVPCQ